MSDKAAIIQKAMAGVRIPLDMTDVMLAARQGIIRGVEVCWAELGGDELQPAINAAEPEKHDEA